MKFWALVGVLALAGALVGCSTAPSKPRPTAPDVVAFKDEAATIAEEASTIAAEAKLNPLLSSDRVSAIDEQLQKITSQTKDLQHHFDQLAEAAGIGTTVESKKAK